MNKVKSKGGRGPVLFIHALVLAAGIEPAVSQEGAGEAFDGRWIYDIRCGTCHGTNGEGIYAFGNSLRDNPFIVNESAEAIIEVIQNGRYARDRRYADYPGMPPFDYIRGGEARALVDYLKEGLQQ